MCMIHVSAKEFAARPISRVYGAYKSEGISLHHLLQSIFHGCMTRTRTVKEFLCSICCKAFFTGV